MIPEAAITHWRNVAPWPQDAQVEQDLILSRAVVEIFREPLLARALLLRGGTALHKLFITPARRYSEDIDLVQAAPGPIGPVLDAIRARLDPLLGTPRRENTPRQRHTPVSHGIRDPTSDPASPRRRQGTPNGALRAEAVLDLYVVSLPQGEHDLGACPGREGICDGSSDKLRPVGTSPLSIQSTRAPAGLLAFRPFLLEHNRQDQTAGHRAPEPARAMLEGR